MIKIRINPKQHIQKHCFVYVVLILLSACNNTGKVFENYYLTTPKADRSNDYELFLADTFNVIVPKSKFSQYDDVAIFKDSLLFGINSRRPFTIDVYDLVNEEFTFDINGTIAAPYDPILCDLEGDSFAENRIEDTDYFSFSFKAREL